MKKINYFSLNRISKKIVLIDGIPRTGKLLLASLVSSFDKMEHLEFGENFEHFIPAVKFNKIPTDFAKSFLNNYLNQLIYNKYISRNVNFRPHDRTGINQSRNPKLYKKRLRTMEGDHVIKSIKKQNHILPLVTHDMSVNLDALYKLKMNFKIIEILRSPVEIVYSWYKRGLGLRFGSDPRIFTLLMKRSSKVYPWYEAAERKSYGNLSPCEVCIKYVINLTNLSIENLKKKSLNKNIFLTSYDQITQNTLSELKKISKFLGTKTNKKTLEFIKKENCPILFNKDNYLKKLETIEKLSSNSFFSMLLELQKKYDQNYYNLKR